MFLLWPILSTSYHHLSNKTKIPLNYFLKLNPLMFVFEFLDAYVILPPFMFIGTNFLKPMSYWVILLISRDIKLLNLTSWKVFISRDVSFHEHIFLFLSHDSASTPSSPTIPPHSLGDSFHSYHIAY